MAPLGLALDAPAIALCSHAQRRSAGVAEVRFHMVNECARSDKEARNVNRSGG